MKSISTRLSLAATIALLASLIPSCRQATSPVEPCSASQDLQLSIGNVWRYDAYRLDTNGAKIAGSDWVETDSVTRLDSVAGRLAYTILITNSSSTNPTNDTLRISFSNSCSAYYYGTCDCDVWSIFGVFDATRQGIVDTESNTRVSGTFLDSTGSQAYVYQTNTHRLFNRGMVALTVDAGNFQALDQCDSTIETLSPPGVFFRSNGKSDTVLTQERFFVSTIGLVKSVGNGQGKELVSYSVH